MGALIVFLLFVAVLLICTPRAERGLALGAMALVGAVIWLAVRIHLHSIVGSMVGTVLALGWEYRNDLLLFFAAAIVLIVPILMIYMTACDQLDRRAAARKIRARRSLKGLGLTLRSEHPWLWLMDEETSSRMPRTSGRRHRQG
ncbi:MAG: hypothetical protein WCC04_13125 [Terriglobales bacterium]